MKRSLLAMLLAIMLCLGGTAGVHATTSCARPHEGSVASRPPDLYSQNGALRLALIYTTTTDEVGRTLFCFKTTNGLQSPTLHVRPGDTLDIAVTNSVPALPAGAPTEIVSNASNVCGAATMTETSVNIHFHGTNTSPVCHQDEVIHTLINSGQRFRYILNIPVNEPPGLYWYHPHVHGIAEAAVQGGASGVIVVEGIAELQPAVTGLPERILVIRDQTVGATPVPKAPIPAWDISLNYVPISYPTYIPAILELRPEQKEFWRVVNASADTVVDLQLQYDGRVQPMQMVGLDGVPLNSQDGTRRGATVTVMHVLLPPAGRAEFIMKGPPEGVHTATLVTQNIDTGPDGDLDPTRTLATLRTTMSPTPLPNVAAPSREAWSQRFERLDTAPITAKRHLYFSEVLSDPNNPASPTNFFITVNGASPALFDPTNPPAIVTTQGAVEDWTIENRAMEVHEFHIHQIHFKLLAQNGNPVPAVQQQFMDTIQVPYWSGAGPYPSVTVRMDFRGPDTGDFVYHCHILGHEDNGMMAVIRVLPKS